MNRKLLLFSGFILFIFYSFNASSQQVAKQTPFGRAYLEYLPPGYSTSTGLYPCIIFLHGSGERGNVFPTDLQKVTSQGTPKFIKNGATMCFTVNGVTECFIVLSPQQTTNRWGWQGDVMPFIKWAIDNYRIDPDRLFVTGLSMGGDGTWDTSYDVNNEPNYIAATAPVSCKGDYNLAKITAQRKIAVWAFHGDKDTAVPITDGRRPINGMNSVNANPVPIFTTVIGGGHSGTTWDKVYSPSNTFYNPNVYQWFLTQRRGVAAPKPPVVSAGTNKTITLPTNTVSQTGTASDPDGTISSTLWTQISGPNTAVISAPNTLTSNFSSLIQGTYQFNLKATDNSGLSTSAQFNVQVLPQPAPVPPTANAGADKSITEPTNSIILTGSGTDTDGTITSYLWTQISGPNTATLTGATTTSVTANNLIPGSYTFSLTVTDNSGLTGSDQVIVTVLAAPPNNPPAANAGADKSITLPVNSTSLTGTATDSDGTIASISWAQSSGPSSATIASPNQLTTTVSNLIAGVYTFNFTARDNKGSESTDQVNITVLPEPPNALPIANAGADITITLPINSTSLNGAGTDSDGTISTYSWTQTSGPNSATIGSASASNTTITNLVEGNYLFTLTVTDNKGGQGSDQVLVKVLPEPPNIPPVSNAGADKSITLPTNTIQLTGTGTDTDGTIATYLWKQQSGPNSSSIVNANQSTTQVNNLIVGVYSFELLVTDNKGATSSDLVVITVFPPANVLPTANAGANQSITLPANSANLSGSGTDSDGSIVSYLWAQISGPGAATITSAATPNTSVNNLIAGIYVFSLTVTDNNGGQATAQVTITVLPEPPNTPPTANAGANQTITLPINSTTLSGTGTDPDGSIVAFLWEQVSGPASATISSPTTAGTSISNLVTGIYVFSLTATDNRGAKAADQVNVTVLPEPPNAAPIASAGADKTITLPVNTVSLTGSGSDSDGSIVSFLWEQVSGPTAAALSTASSASTNASNLVAGVYIFALTVTDNLGAKAADQVIVTVLPEPVNLLPVANAGPDQNLTLPINTVVLAGNGTDSDGTIVSYLWSFVSGPGAGTTSDLNQANLTLSNLVEGIYVFQLTVTDNRGGTAVDEAKIFVNASQIPPIANAGIDLTITLPTNSITITGSATDSDGTVESFVWEQVSGPNTATITNPLQSDITVSSLIQGSYTFKLVVTDNDGLTDSDQMTLTVNPEPPNVAPVANPGTNQTITLPINSITLSGSGTDSDGTITSYAWSQISGPNTATSTSLTNPSITFSNMIFGTYVFRLTVTDDRGAKGQKDVNVVVNPEPPNSPPVAITGADQIITLPINSVTIIGSGTDSDGTISGVAWSQLSGPSTATTTSLTSATITFSNLIAGTYIFRLIVTDDKGSKGQKDLKITVNPEPPNSPPVANAGSDKEITLPINSITLTGSGTDSDGTITSYLWSQVNGPNSASSVSLTNPSVTFNNLIAGTYIFRLTVTDNKGANGQKDVNVKVNPQPANLPPVVEAGSNQQITLPISTVNLSGTATDSDGSIATVQWVQISGPSIATFSAPASLNTNASNLAEGIYLMRLNATDDKGVTSFDELTITVKPIPFNVPPLSDAGTNKIITLPVNSVSLSGSGTDLDGSISQYTWSQISGPSTASTTSLTQPTLNVSNMIAGIYLFRLTVTDNQGSTGFDEVNITVQPAPANQPPTASAGTNKVITLPINSVVFNGSGNDSDGTINVFAWTQQSGPSTAVISAANQPDLTVSSLLEGTYIFRLTVTDNIGATGFDEVNVRVNPPLPNVPPLVNVGTNQSITLPVNSITINGTATDSDGTITELTWTQISGPNTATLTGANSTTLIAQNLIAGNYIFRLTAKDNGNLVSFSEIKVTVNPVPPNSPPIVNAGPDVELVIPPTTYTLSGTATDSDGTITGILWTQLTGPNTASINNNQSLTTSLSNLVEGLYSFELSVTDNSGNISLDDVVISIKNNAPPIAFAGEDIELIFPVSSIDIIGGGTDTDGSIVSYKWVQVTGPNTSSITSPDQPTISVQGLIVGAYVFELEVTDNNGGKAKAQITVNVITPPQNQLPTVDAGQDITVVLPVSEADLKGIALDQDGEIINIQWVQVDGPSQANILTPAGLETKVTNLILGVYIFELEVTDNGGLKNKDQINIKVDNLNLNDLTFPKIFSPNSDGKNDFWTWGNTIYTEGCELSIFTNWGMKVFEKISYDNSWDGTNNGNPLEDGAYYYIIKCPDGQQKTGGVRIIR
jgi:gliding motility-associated-like protein